MPSVDNKFTGAAMLICLFPLVGLLARTQIESDVVVYGALSRSILNFGGMAIAVLCPLIGIGALVISTGVDSSRRKDNLPNAAGKSKLAGKMTLAGYVVGFPILAAILFVAFFGFLKGGAEHTKVDRDAAKEGAAEEAAEGEAAPAEGDKKADEKAPEKAEAAK